MRDSPIYRLNTLFANLPVCTVDHRTSLVPDSALAEGRYCDRRTISCQLHSFKDTLRFNFIFRMRRTRLGLTENKRLLASVADSSGDDCDYRFRTALAMIVKPSGFSGAPREGLSDQQAQPAVATPRS